MVAVRQTRTEMARKVKKAFDPKVFLATVNHGRTASTYARDAIVFRQTGPADAVFYIRKGRIKIEVASKQGKEAVVAVLGAGRVLRRRLPDRPAFAAGDGPGDGRKRGHAGGQGRDDPRPS